MNCGELYVEAFVEWQKCRRGGWCCLSELDLAHSHFEDMSGVYVIWYEDESPLCLRVGRGFIRNCLIQELHDEDILVHRQKQELFVTWARVGSMFREGVTKYIGEALNQKLSSTVSNAEPIEVNFPWHGFTSFPWE